MNRRTLARNVKTLRKVSWFSFLALSKDQMLTADMGGVLPEQPDPTVFQRVLDVGCGTGGWLIEAASTYPTISVLVGVDVSERFVEHAQAQAVHMCVPDDRYGLINELVPLFERHNIGNVQSQLHTLEYRAGIAEGQMFIQDLQHLFRTLLPFLRKWSHVPDDYEEIYRQALDEMQHTGFVTTWKLLTVWGTNP